MTQPELNMVDQTGETMGFVEVRVETDGYSSPVVGELGAKALTLGQGNRGAWDDNSDSSKGYKGWES